MWKPSLAYACNREVFIKILLLENYCHGNSAMPTLILAFVSSYALSVKWHNLLVS